MKAEKRAERGARTFEIVAKQWASLALVSLAVACSSSSNPGGAGGEGGSGEGASGGMGGTGGMGGSAPTGPEMVVTFKPFEGELAEGLVIEGNTAYVSLAVINKVIKIDLDTGVPSDFGTINAPIGIGVTLGLAVDNGTVYAAAASENTAQFAPGIYKFPAGGGPAQLFGKHVELTRPRGIALDGQGGLLITAPRLGALYSMALADGVITPLDTAPELTGDLASACKSGEPYRAGANGLFITVGSTYVSNADRATIFELGAKVSTLAGPDCATLGGADGMVGDVDGSMFVAARKANAITRVKYNGEVDVLMKDDLLHEPSAVAIATVGGKRYLYWVNSARTTFSMGGVPGLGRMPIGGTE
jgi:hypothetical protein